MLTALPVLPTKVGVSPGTTTFTLGDPALCDRGPRAALQRERFFPALRRVLADKAQEAAAILAPTVVPQPTKATPFDPAAPRAQVDPAAPRGYYMSPYATFEELRGPKPARGNIRGLLQSLFKGSLGRTRPGSRAGRCRPLPP